MNLIYTFNYNFFIVPFAGVTGSLMLVISSVGIIMNYIKKMIIHKLELRRLEETYQEQLLSASISFQEAERQRIAADLHDDVGPLLSLAGFYMDDASESLMEAGKESQTKARELLNNVVDTIRRISYDMSPYGLEELGLYGTITRILDQVSNSRPVETGLAFSNKNIRLETKKELMLFRVVQELINNILKHSGASYIRVSQINTDEQYMLRISHDGKGLDQESFELLRKSGKGMGLKNITSRLLTAESSIHYMKGEGKNIISLFTPLTQSFHPGSYGLLQNAIISN